MNKITSLFHTEADYLYPWILLVTTLASGAVLWIRVPHRIMDGSAYVAHMFSTGLGRVMMLTALGVLAWRAWMAWRYRTYPMVDDNALPTVTVVIPAYNEGRQILATVRSIMASNYPVHKMQVIGVDDGSADDTWRWMLQARREFPGRLQLIRQDKNSGKRQALMAGFGHAHGSVFVTIDSDSEVLPDTLSHLASPFASDPRVGAVAGNVRVLNHGDGAIPKMMDVSFTMAFDFTRCGQSVYGGVFCTPGALSAYRASVIKDHLEAWAKQTFMGVPATIGEDRALSNCVLKSGYRVVYQREAIVLTKIPASFGGLRRMMIRWARSNVRESLVMATFMLKRFRRGDSGGGWVRFFGTLQLFRLVMTEALKVGLMVHACTHPIATMEALFIGCLASSAVPALVHQIRYGGSLGWRWSLPYSLFWMFGLSWISFWGVLTASRSGWLTRDLPSAAGSLAHAPAQPSVPV